MIRKPDARDFRERTTVTVIRDARSLTVEGARGARQGVRSAVKWWLIGTTSFGFLTSALMTGPVGMLIVGGIGLTWFLWWKGKRQRRNAYDHAVQFHSPTMPAPSRVIAPASIAPERFELTAGVAGRAATKIAVPALILFPASTILPFSSPFMLAGVVALALAMMIVAKLFGDRTLLVYDAESITAKGLLGNATMLWTDVADVTVRRSAWWNLRVLFTSGGRHNLLIVGRINRLGGPDTLYLPIDLLALDTPALTSLISRMLLLCAGAPLPDASAVAPTPVPAPPPLVDQASLDPDAIMARYMTEREALLAAQRTDRATMHKPRTSFGRKVA